jgi:hypothetical protein
VSKRLCADTEVCNLDPITSCEGGRSYSRALILIEETGLWHGATVCSRGSWIRIMQASL